MTEPQTIAQALRDALGAVMREQWSGTRTQMAAEARDALDGQSTLVVSLGGGR